MERLSTEQRQLLRKWFPAGFSAATAWLIMLIVGETPIARASGLALAIFGVTAGMRQMGFVASIAGGLTLAFCPVFWSQTGGGQSQPSTIVLAASAAGLAMMAASRLFKRSDLGIASGIVLFLLIFWSQSGTAQSLRLSGLATAWLLYLLVDMILLTNPRPGIQPARNPKPWHTAGLLFLFAVGAINDPLVTLLAPALMLALFLSYARLPAHYWLGIFAIIAFGSYLLVRAYILPSPTPLDVWGWREAASWIELGQLVIAQFSIFGIVLGVIGLARLSRWYPPLGTVTLIAYAAYICFGLTYRGSHREVLLIPLFIIQVMWMTYAVNTIGQWVNKSLGDESGRWIHIVSSLYFALPAFLFLEILQR
ncbi:MAG: hypothetical protein OXG68_05345 [Chloroflexi bacterium]|nr:hypothetical protein [Chloroflexota bacterium]